MSTKRLEMSDLLEYKMEEQRMRDMLEDIACYPDTAEFVFTKEEYIQLIGEQLKTEILIGQLANEAHRLSMLSSELLDENISLQDLIFEDSGWNRENHN